jgi:hypothetical protein
LRSEGLFFLPGSVGGSVPSIVAGHSFFFNHVVAGRSPGMIARLKIPSTPCSPIARPVISQRPCARGRSLFAVELS